MPAWMQAGFWGLVAGLALVGGAAVAWFVRVPQRLVAVIMAFGSGVLVSALSFELLEQAWQRGGLGATASGFLCGAVVYTVANAFLERQGAVHRKRSRDQQLSEDEHAGSGKAIALGALLDGIPESIVIGVSLLGGKGVNAVTVLAIFLSNIPEGLSSAAGMKNAGRSAGYVFGVWGGIALCSGAAALLGYSLFHQFSPEVIAATTAFAAGAILCMLADTMIPEAFEEVHGLTGLVTVLGFLTIYTLDKLGA